MSIKRLVFSLFMHSKLSKMLPATFNNTLKNSNRFNLTNTYWHKAQNNLYSYGTSRLFSILLNPWIFGFFPLSTGRKNLKSTSKICFFDSGHRITVPTSTQRAILHTVQYMWRWVISKYKNWQLSFYTLTVRCTTWSGMNPKHILSKELIEGNRYTNRERLVMTKCRKECSFNYFEYYILF